MLFAVAAFWQLAKHADRLRLKPTILRNMTLHPQWRLWKRPRNDHPMLLLNRGTPQTAGPKRATGYNCSSNHPPTRKSPLEMNFCKSGGLRRAPTQSCSICQKDFPALDSSRNLQRAWSWIRESSSSSSSSLQAEEAWTRSWMVVTKQRVQLDWF